MATSIADRLTQEEYATQLLSHFFAISPETIDRDIAGAEENLEQLQEETRISGDLNNDDSPKSSALFYHKQLLCGSAMRNSPQFSKAQSLQQINFPIDSIAFDAHTVALTQGRMAEISQFLRDIEKREGLPAGKDWHIGEGPEDYQRLSEELDQYFERISDTVFLQVFRRYRLDDVAELFENDRKEYERLVEEGRTFMFGP